MSDNHEYIVSDEVVSIHFWCLECEETVVVKPLFLDNGTPVCPQCDCDMGYSHTTLDLDQIKVDTVKDGS